MSITVQCPGCRKRYKVDERFAGKKVKCQSCGGAIVVGTAAPAPAKVAPSDDPFAAMDELERTGTATPDNAYAATPPPVSPAAAAPRRSGTVYNPALAQTTVNKPQSAGVSQSVKIGLSVGVGLLFFVLGFWAVHALTGGSPKRTLVASQGSRPAAAGTNSNNPDGHGLEAGGVADIAEGLSGNRTARAPAPQNSAPPAPPAPASADVEVKPPAVLKPFAGPDPKYLDQLGDDTWLPSAPYVFKCPKVFGGQGSMVSNQSDPELISYMTPYVWIGPPRNNAPLDNPIFTVETQPRHNKKFPRVLTQATEATKYSVTPRDPMDTQLLFEGAKVEFGTLDGVETVRAVGKDVSGRNAVTYVMLDDKWFMRFVISNVTPGTPDFEVLDAMVRTFHHKNPRG